MHTVGSLFHSAMRINIRQHPSSNTPWVTTNLPYDGCYRNWPFRLHMDKCVLSFLYQRLRLYSFVISTFRRTKAKYRFSPGVGRFSVSLIHSHTISPNKQVEKQYVAAIVNSTAWYMDRGNTWWRASIGMAKLPISTPRVMH